MDDIALLNDGSKKTFPTLFGPEVFGSTKAALSIFEVLLLVLSFNDRKANARCARVCKGWRDPALELVWEWLYSFRPLLCLLPCIELSTYNEDNEYELKLMRPIEHADWERFNAYAKKVKTFFFHVPIPEGEEPDIAETTLVELAIARPSMTFLPQLRELTCDWEYIKELHPLWLRFSRLFLHVDLQSLELMMPSDMTKKNQTAVFLREVPLLSPKLTVFILFCQSPMAVELKTDVAELLSQLDNLRTLDLPRYYISQEILDQVVLLPHLLDLRATDGDDVRAMPIIIPDSSQHLRDRHALTKLRNLDIHGSLDYVGALLRVFFSGRYLNNLKVSFVEYDLHRSSPNGTLEDLIKLFCEECPGIRRLEISCYDYYANHGFPAGYPLPIITKQTLQPLGTFHLLDEVKITYHQPTDNLADDDILDVLSGLERIRSFHLICEVGSRKHPSLTLAVLDRLAQRTTSLEDLTLHVDATRIPKNVSSAPFLALKRLCLAGSPIQSPSEVAVYLGQLFLPSSVLELESPSYRKVSPEITARNAIWKEAKLYLQFGYRSRTSDWEVIRAQRSKIADLEDQLALISSED